MKRKKDVAVDQGVAAKAFEKAMFDLCNSPAFLNPREAFLAAVEEMSSNDAEKPPTVKLWKELYEVAKNIRMLEPWKYLNEDMRFTLLLPGRDEPVYIVVMGNAELTYGIGIYPGFESLRRLTFISDSDGEDVTAAFEQHCINLYFGEKEELEEQDHKAIIQTGNKFSDKGDWPYFRSMKPGFFPWFINRDEAKLALDVLQNFAMAFLAYVKEGMDVDFERGQTLLRFYDEAGKLWYNTAIKMPPVPFIEAKMIIPDELAASLKKKKKTKNNLGFILTYLPLPVQKSKKHRPKLPLVALLANMKSGKLIDHTLGLEQNEEGNMMDARVEYIGFLINHVENNGRPASIAVSNMDTYYFVEDFAKKLGIKLEVDERLSDITSMFLNTINMFDLAEEEFEA